MLSESKKFVSDNPKMLAEWDFDKNSARGLFPDQVGMHSNKKAWWKCPKCNQSYLMIIEKKCLEHGCPICAKRLIIPGINDLKTLYPEVALDRDYSKNIDLDINTIRPITRKKVHFKCHICGHEWCTSLCNRTEWKMTGCPVCACFKGAEKARKTNIANRGCISDAQLLEEWDYEKNGDLKPEDFTINSTRIVWWKCSKCGYSFQKKIQNRVANHKGCPVCNNKVIIQGTNDLETTDPELAKEWDYEKNYPLLPSQISRGSGKSVWWICPLGHSYKTTPNKRTSGIGTGCPICFSGRQTSFAEQAIYFYLRKIYKSSINRYKPSKKSSMEFDIYIPELNIAIEYDGIHRHPKNKEQRELRKYQICKKSLIKLIRVRESDKISDLKTCDKLIVFGEDLKSIELSRKIKELIKDVIETYDQKNGAEKLAKLKSLQINVEKDNVVINQYKKGDLKINFEIEHPEIAKEWNYEKNGELKPSQFKSHSNFKARWKCSICGYEWQTSIGHRTDNTGCPNCYIMNKSINNPSNKPIIQLTLDGKFVKEWPSIVQAARALNLSDGNLGSVLHHRRNKTGGYKWLYKEEYLSSKSNK